MALRNYNETDLTFYSEKDIDEINVDITLKGNIVSWNPVDYTGGYAIYRGESDGWHLIGTVEESTTSYTDYEAAGSPVDYKVTSIIEGDIFFGEDDLVLTGDHESARQDITNRLRSQKGQWRSHPEIGADLELLEGEPNTRETANRGIDMITEALTFDNRFYDSDFTVRPVPTSITQVDYYVILDSDENEPLVVKQSLEM